VLRQIGFPDAERMIRDCKDAGLVDLDKLDYSGVLSLAQEIGVMDAAEKRDSFVRHGLVAPR
jgi:hypothetical protein